MKYFVGVDGGGSGCRVILTSEKGSILARASGGPANIETSFVTARENIIKSCKVALKLAKIPRNSARIRIRNRCEITGRPHGVYRKLRISRIALRDLASNGKIPGMTKSSW